jgi:hypothetical protein
MKTIRLANMRDLDSVAAIVRDATRHMDDQGIPQRDIRIADGSFSTIR